MFKIKKPLSKSTTIVAFGFSVLLLTISCGKQTISTAQTDDINMNAPIVYSGGWGGAGVTISISSEILSENQANPSYQSIVPQLQNAINSWNAAIGHTVLTLNTSNYLSETGNTLQSCGLTSNRLYYPLCYSFKGVFYDRVSSAQANLPQAQWTSGWAYNTGKDISILATTVWNARGDTMTAADIRFNRDSYIFGDSTLDGNIYEDNSEKIIVDLETVALHELGHVLGLGHASREQDSIMYPTMNIGPDATNPNYESGVESTKRILSACDINRAQHVYAGAALIAACN